MAALTENQRTLRPVGEAAEALTPFDETRVLVESEQPLGREWVPTTDLLTGKPIEVRSASCGGGCHCAGEVRIVGN